MTTIGWRFPPLSGGTRQGYTNNDIEVFKGQELMDNLAREICQNSLDAVLPDSNKPVRVVFELRFIEKAKYNVFAQFEKCIEGCRAYWGDEMDTRLARFLEGAEATLAGDMIPILVASDYNTRGLSGSHDHKIKTPWEALTGSDGVSLKNDQNSGGSYGIGKNAPFACSACSMVFYNSLAQSNEQAFIGVSRLATLKNEAGKDTQRVGKYQKNDEENEVWEPIYPEDDCDFRDCFPRTEQGTDVIIVAFNQHQGWRQNVAKAVLKNFFVAIAEEKLIVEIVDGPEKTVINATGLSQLFSDYSEGSDKEMISAMQLYKAFTTPDCKETLTVKEENDVEVYVKSDSSYNRTIANFRKTGMRVGTYFKRIYQHYAAVVIVRGKALGALLLETEPPRHNRWDYKQIEARDKDKRKDARECINKIDAFVLEVLKSQFEVVTEDAVDAAGVGEYIPDDTDGMGGQAEGQDILKARIKIGKIKRVHVDQGSSTEVGTQDEGQEQVGEVHNHRKNPNPLPPKPRPPKPVDPNPDEPDPKPGVTTGLGVKSLTTPKMAKQRAYPINSAQGLYRIVIVPSESYSNFYISCQAVGEDGKTEDLNLEAFTYNSKSIKTDKNTAGPIQVEADTPAIFFAKFAKKEKMKLVLKMTEVIPHEVNKK